MQTHLKNAALAAAIRVDRNVKLKALSDVHVDQEELLTCKQLAWLLQISTETLVRWRAAAIGPDWINVGRYIRYRPSDVKAWMAARPARGG